MREHHILFGWLAFVTATAHAVYFAVDSPTLTTEAVTGWAAWAVMAVTLVAGTLLNRSLLGRREAKNIRVDRRVHGILAASFIVVLSLHSAILAVALALWIVMAIPTVLIWSKRRWRRTMKSRPVR